MKTIDNAVRLLLSLGLALLVFVGCENDYPDSVFDPNAEGTTAPTISEVNAQPTYNGSIMAGLSVVTLSGQNFSAVAEENFVYFNDFRAQVLNASATQVQVLAPGNAIGDSVRLRTTVFGSEFFTDLIYLKIIPTVQEHGTFVSTDIGIRVAADIDENVYVGMRANMIKKIDPLGETIEWAAKPIINGNDMKMGPGNLLYMSFVISPRGAGSRARHAPGRRSSPLPFWKRIRRDCPDPVPRESTSQGPGWGFSDSILFSPFVKPFG